MDKSVYENYIIAVVIPCYKVEATLESVVFSLPEYVKNIILVNDKSPDNTVDIINSIKEKDARVSVVNHNINEGVGGAMISGFKVALELCCDYVIKLDGDGQMDASYIPDLLDPVIQKKADYTKGNRFDDFKELVNMPFERRLGNIGLSFLIKASSGYWNIFDPSNGFFCIDVSVLKKLDFNRLDKRFFFESSLLNELYYTGAEIEDIPMPAIYGDEISNLSVSKVLFQFPPKLFKAFVRRIFLRYFVYEFSIYSIFLLLGVPLFLFGFIFGIINWVHYSCIDVPAPVGTIMVATLSIVLSFQLLLSVINYDIVSRNPFKKNKH